MFQHASALERLKDHLKEGDTALDVGSGSGYLTVCMAQMVCFIILLYYSVILLLKNMHLEKLAISFVNLMITLK